MLFGRTWAGFIDRRFEKTLTVLKSEFFGDDVNDRSFRRQGVFLEERKDVGYIDARHGRADGIGGFLAAKRLEAQRGKQDVNICDVNR